MNDSSTLATTRPAPAMAGRRAKIVALTAAVFLYWVALYLYMPTLPTYVQRKTADLALVGVVLAQYGLWQAVVRLPIGIFSDWVGRRKPFIVVGFGICGLGAWLLGSAGDVTGLLVGRAVVGIAAGTWVPLVVLFSSLFPPEDAVRSTAALTFVGSAGRVLATGVTGSLNNLGGYSLAFFGAVAAAGLAMLIILVVAEERRPSRRPSLGSIGGLFRRKDIMLPSLLSLLAQYASWASTFGFFPILAKELGASDVVQSLLVSGNVLMVLFGNLTATFIVNRIGAKKLVLLTYVLIFLAFGAAALAHSLPLLMLGQAMMGYALGVNYPVLMGMSIRYVADSERSSAMGLHQAIYAIGMFAGPWLSGILAQGLGIRPMFTVTAFVGLALGVVGGRWLVEGKRSAGA